MKTYNHYINDEWVEPSSGVYLDSENPFTGEIWARVARGNAEDADLAVKAAKEAFENSDWADMRLPSAVSVWSDLLKSLNGKPFAWKKSSGQFYPSFPLRMKTRRLP